MSSSELTDLRRIRGGYKSKTTKHLNTLTKMKDGSLKRYSLPVVERTLTVLETAYAGFQENHEQLVERDPSLTDEAADTALDEYQLAHDTAMEIAEYIRACAKLRDQGDEIQSHLRAIKPSLNTGYTKSLEEDYAIINAALRKHSKLFAAHGASDHPDLSRDREHILSEWETALQVRADSGYTDETPPPRLPPPASPATEVTRMQSISVTLPHFSGKTTEYRGFKKLFLAIISKQKHLSEEEKMALLLRSMDSPEAKTNVRLAIKNATTFEEALEDLAWTYENFRDIVAENLLTYAAMPTIGQNHKDVAYARRLLADEAQGVIDADCKTASQVLASLMCAHFDPTLKLVWRTHSGALTRPADMTYLNEFLRMQDSVIGKSVDSTKGRPPRSTPPPRKTSTRRKQETSSSHGRRERSPTRKRHERTPFHVKRERSSSPERSPSPPPPTVFQAVKPKKCSYCKGEHSTFSCEQFTAMTPHQRQDWVKESKRCFNCLRDKHVSADCKSQGRCQDCNSSHHTLLHLPKWDSSKGGGQKSTKGLVARTTEDVSVAPITAVVEVSAGEHHRLARLMVDTGSNTTMVSKELALSLQTKPEQHTSMRISGLGTVVSPYSIQLKLHGNAEMGLTDETVNVEARVLDPMPQPDNQAPNRKLRQQPFLKNRILADPDFGPGARVDIILDLQTWQLCRRGEVLPGPRLGVWAESSVFGWVTGGCPLEPHVSTTPVPTVLISRTSDEAWDHLITQQWMDPELPNDRSHLSIEDENAELSFNATCKRMESGRYEVGMPEIDNPPKLGESRRQAASRYRSVKKSLKAKKIWEPFDEAMKDLVKSGHAERVPEEDLKKPPHLCYYMPVHGVWSASSTTTKVRPVCDASAATTSGASYNDTLATGPCAYHSLTSIVNQWREYLIAMTADVSKMFHQVSLRKEDRDFHRFLMEENGILVDYRKTTVTFGVKSSPYVATKVLQRIATDQESTHPAAAKALRTSFYVDDVLTGAQTMEEALQLRSELNDALQAGGMPLCKWRTNDAGVLEAIPPELRDKSKLQLSSSPSAQHKALGLHWDTLTDNLHVSTPSIAPADCVTKRQLVSATAQIFDPMGWFGPTIMMPRILTQKAWRANADWDEPLSPEITLTWQGWLREMPSITQHAIPRALRLPDEILESRQLHGFSDASTQAFGGVVFLRSTYISGKVDVRQVAAKGKVAPMGKTTVPRLELRGALVLSILIQTVAEDLHIAEQEIVTWSDSTVVLGWLRQSPAKLEVYVGNRVRKVQQALPGVVWRHVPGIENPADCLSRGVRPDDLCNHQLWWNGPDWLTMDEQHWPSRTMDEEYPLPEMRRVALITQTPRWSLDSGQTNFRQWIRVVGWVQRFWYNYTHPLSRITTTHLTSLEYQVAERTALRASQRRSLGDTLELVLAGKGLSKRSPLRKLAPFMDEGDGLLKVGGRLEHSDMPATAKHPIILHAGDPLVKLMIEDIHVRMMHPPISATLATIAYTHHILKVRQTLKSITHQCLKCQRKWAQPGRQQMGNLPAVRCTKADVFANVGVDYAGPLFVTQGRGRGYSKVKAYVALFVCLATRAIHLELVADVSAKSFLAALDRFCGRRGKPGVVYSDNGSNFHGGNAELVQTLKEAQDDDTQPQVAKWSLGAGIQWHFQPAYAPNFGGLWEAGVRIMKELIRDSLHLLKLNQDELVTILVSAEAVLNSRPYLPVFSTDQEGFCPLTPGHFLVGRPLCSLPQRVDIESKLCNVRRWDLVKRMEFHLWRHYSRRVLTQLSSRGKQFVPQDNLKKGDVVLLTDQHTRRNAWPLGLVVNVFPGEDGLVRAAEVRVCCSKTPSSRMPTRLYRRSIRHLIKMPIHIPQEEATSLSELGAGEYVEDSDGTLGEPD